jgi:hypothetical protein
VKASVPEVQTTAYGILKPADDVIIRAGKRLFLYRLWKFYRRIQ